MIITTRGFEMNICRTFGSRQLPSIQGESEAAVQKIIVFQQNGSGERKIKGLRDHADGLLELEIVSIDEPLPTILDDSDDHLPGELKAGLVLDFLKHPDLSHDLAKLCWSLNIPIVASGKKLRVRWAITPPTWCGLSRQVCLGFYGERFGAPEFAVEVAAGKIVRVEVIRGAPCGATWEAAARILGRPAEEAATRIGLETQYFCSANPAGWDPLNGKSPVHFAGEVHKTALLRAIEKLSPFE
jgi:thymidylate synthase